MNGLRGKGFFLWKVRDCERGNPQAIAETAQAAGLTHLLVKVADGPSPYNIDRTTGYDLLPPVVDAARRAGMQVWGWHYVYGYDPQGEARIAVRRVQELALDGYVIDAEQEYKEPGKVNAARRFMQSLRQGLPRSPIALSSYRFPSYHPQLPWQAFLEGCDFNMPQVYWEKAHNPAAQLQRCVREFQALNPARPVIPTGAAYKWDGWRATADDVQEFLQAAQALGLPAVNFWSWDNCRRDLPEVWQRIAGFPYGAPLPIPAEEMPQRLIRALNSHNPEAVAGLYRPNAVQVTATRTIQGHTAIRAWYEQLFARRLPQASFMLTGSGGVGPARHFTWKAEAPAGRIDDGSDTLGVVDGKIVFHYSSYRIENR